jgi:HAD superfamily hydrolase (TIGR01490 family)
MSGRWEARDVKEAKEERENGGGVAAFFDLDGTLLARPSLERRFFAWLRARREIHARNYFWWMAEAARLAPRGIAAVRHSNKKYLRGVRAAEGRAGMMMPEFFSSAMERMAWHARQGHRIVIVSGTLEPLAREAAMGAEAELEARGVVARVHVCATRLEERDGRWTGRVLGEAMYGQAKARAVRRIAAQLRMDRAECFAYGDTLVDQWMLGSVGRAAAVNPSEDLLRFAQRERWPVLCWGGCETRPGTSADLPPRAPSSRRTRTAKSSVVASGSRT